MYFYKYCYMGQYKNSFAKHLNDIFNTLYVMNLDRYPPI